MDHTDSLPPGYLGYHWPLDATALLYTVAGLARRCCGRVVYPGWRGVCTHGRGGGGTPVSVYPARTFTGPHGGTLTS